MSENQILLEQLINQPDLLNNIKPAEIIKIFGWSSFCFPKNNILSKTKKIIKNIIIPIVNKYNFTNFTISIENIINQYSNETTIFINNNDFSLIININHDSNFTIISSNNEILYKIYNNRKKLVF